MALASNSCNLSSFSSRRSHRALPSPFLGFTFQKRSNLNLARSLKVMSLFTEKPFTEAQPPTICGCGFCNKRQLLDGLGVVPPSSFARPVKGDESADMITFAQKIKDEVHPSKPEWYEKLYAMILDNAIKCCEAEFAGYKVQLLNQLKGEAEQILELGIGTGPNIQYYASGSKVSVVGVDPNKQMEKYALAAAAAVGIPESQFKFICGVGEALPVLDSSMDAVVCTLVLCSVKDVKRTLKEVQRVLKPGGRFIFIEHVAAPDGTTLRFWQNLLDPLQQFIFDGCHLARQTGKNIIESGFSKTDVNSASIKGAPLVSPIVFGTAYK